MIMNNYKRQYRELDDETKEIMTCINNSGYCTGSIKDCYGNIYHGAH